MNKHQGFSIIEMMVALAISSVLVLGLASILMYTLRSMTSLEKTATIMEILKETDYALSREPDCTANLKNTRVSLGKTTGEPIVGDSSGAIYYRDGTGVKVKDSVTGRDLEPILQHAKKHRGIYTERVHLVTKARLKSQEYVAELVVDVKKLESGMGPEFVTRSIPLYVHSDASGRLTNCASLFGGSLNFNDNLPDTVKDRICDIAYNGRFYYSVSTDKCEDRYREILVVGNHDSANCSKGSERADQVDSSLSEEEVCDSTLSGDAFVPPGSRTYTGGASRNITAPPVLAVFYGTNACQCDYATDAGPGVASARCRVKCLVEEVPR